MSDEPSGGERLPDPPDDLGPALDLVRGVWGRGRADGVTRQALAWAMMIESVGHLAATQGAAATAGLLDRLGDAVRTTPHEGHGPLQ